MQDRFCGGFTLHVIRAVGAPDIPGESYVHVEPEIRYRSDPTVPNAGPSTLLIEQFNGLPGAEKVNVPEPPETLVVPVIADSLLSGGMMPFAIEAMHAQVGGP